jgi:hypothetical protein
MCRVRDLSISQTRAFAYLHFTVRDADACTPEAWAWLKYELENYAFSMAL